MSARGPLALAILISGRGSNMAAIAESCRRGGIAARVELVISDRREAPGIGAAEALGVPVTVIEAFAAGGRAAHEAALAAAIERSAAGLVLLAGFMRILSPQFVAHHRGRLLNIHPSLLPKHRGLDTHRRALAAGEREHGASVHFVTAELDGGPVILQGRLTVAPGESAASLAGRVLRLEHRIYPRAVGLIADGRLRLEQDAILLDGSPLGSPLIEEEAHGAERACG